MNTRIALTIAAFILTAPVLAAEEQEGPWSGKATLGYLATSGNTENSNLNSGFALGYTTGDWSHLAELHAINATESEVTTAEAYELGWKSEWNMSEKSFLFGRLKWRKDRFSGYDTQFSQTIGYGHRLLNTDEHKLNVEAGVGARQSDLADGTTEEEMIFRGGLQYKWHFSETADFRQEFAVEAGSDNTYGESITALSAKLMGNLALVASYTIKNNSDVPPLTEKTDTYTALSLEYVF
jgi:putative salt-induced outer membrane protein